MLDPHTACGVAAADKLAAEGEVTIALSTAHPAKFDEAIRFAASGRLSRANFVLCPEKQRQTRVEGTQEAIVSELLKFYNA